MAGLALDLGLLLAALAAVAGAAQDLQVLRVVGAAARLGHDVVGGEVAGRVRGHSPARAPVAVLGAVLGYCCGCCGAPCLGVAALVGAASDLVLALLPGCLAGVTA